MEEPDGGSEPVDAGGAGSFLDAALGGSPDPSPEAPNSSSRRLEFEAGRNLRRGDVRRALLDATRAIEESRRNPGAWALRAEISNKLKNHPAALKDGCEALKLDPRNARALRGLSHAHYQMANYEPALHDADLAVRLEPDNVLGYVYRAMAKEKLGDIQEALRDYEKAAQIDPALKPIHEAALDASTLVQRGLSRTPPATMKEAPAPTPPVKPPDRPDVTLSPGAVLGGNFLVCRELGRGGMGVVYEALDQALLRRVAIKRLLAGQNGSTVLKEFFLREARLAAKLRHPNLAQILTVFQEGAELFLVFDFVEGRTLEAVLAEKGPFSGWEAADVIRQVSDALGHAHSQRVIHRDVKPSNIMVTDDRVVKVMDFGIAHEAKSTSAATQTRAWGTPYYMAPEQALGIVSRESDLYSLAVVAYLLLTGAHPFDGEDLAVKKLKKSYQPPTRCHSGFPAVMDEFFDRALEPDAARRYHSTEEFYAAFRGACGGEVPGPA